MATKRNGLEIRVDLLRRGKTIADVAVMVRTVIATRTILDGRFISGRVSLAEVVDASGCPRRPVLRVLERLAREGWLELVEDVRLRPAPGECGPKRRNPAYLVHRDIRLHRAHQDRSRVTCRDKVWSTLRAVRRTTVGNLMAKNYYAGTVGLLIEADCGRDISDAQDTEFLVRLPVSGEVKHWPATIGDDGRSLQYLTRADDLTEVGTYLLHGWGLITPGRS